jgi:predicted ATPase
MLTRLQIQNFRAIEELTLDLGVKNLLMGLNGSGKTSVFDALAALRSFVIDGARCEDVFPLESVPRWLRTHAPQTFRQTLGLHIDSDHGPLRYELVIEQNEKRGSSRVLSESLQDDLPLFRFVEGKVTLFRDTHTEGPKYSSDWEASAMKLVPSGDDNLKMAAFKERLRNTYCLRIDAPGISARSEKESAHLNRDLSNFASWYRRALIANAAAGADFLAAVREVIGGLESLDLAELGQGIMVLQAAFKREAPAAGASSGSFGKSFRLDFNELSHGQQSLIALYALLHFVVREKTTLCIDEPDNFVALAELQPWLFGVQDRVDDLGAQVLIASHHPELLNTLAPDHGIVLVREGAGPTTMRRYAADPGSNLSPAERIARGWDRE